VVVIAAGVILGSALSGPSAGANQTAKASGAATVQRRDLVATDTESGTLSYAAPQTVFNRLSGTITSLPTAGQVIQPGNTLYTVDGNPVVLMNGSFPAYRTLSASVSAGVDVEELKQNLAALGFDSGRQLTSDGTFDAATTAAVERWQASLGETQTGVVTLGQVVFLPGAQRIATVDAALGSTGGGGGGGAAAAAGTGSTSSFRRPASQPEFVSLTAAPAPAPATATATRATATTTTTTSTTTSASSTKTTAGRGRPSAPKAGSGPSPRTGSGPSAPKTGSGQSSSKAGSGSGAASTLAALIALLRAETLELQKARSTTGSGAKTSPSTAGTAVTSTGSARGTGSTRSSGAGATSTSGTGASGASSSAAGAGTASAQAILQTTSTSLVVKVSLDATKQSEAVLGAPVTVQMPDSSIVDGSITAVSAAAQSTSATAAASTTGAGGGSSTPSATVPVTITLKGHRRTGGLDQAAVSVNFEQQKAQGVLSVPVTALLATAGGGYDVQEATAPNRLVPVTPGLFAAGYVQISGAAIYPGLRVTDSQG
jgi:hypothetical protein